ncbi:MAG: hypothetical protein OSB45_04165 [Pseudomonadales bacterium]|jgi:hypothetical protein|nr:hypothetical protein [Pseudomonadales bacterium]
MSREAESIKSATVKRVKALSSPKPLTHGLIPDHRNRAVIDKATAEVKELGYAIIPGFLSKQRLNLLRNDLEPIFEQSGIRNADQGGRYCGLQTVHVHNLFAKTRAVDEIAIDPV